MAVIARSRSQRPPSAVAMVFASMVESTGSCSCRGSGAFVDLVDGAAVGADEREVRRFRGIAVDAPAAVVHEAMVERAQGQTVVDVGGSSAGERHDVMHVVVCPVGAAGEPAAVVAGLDDAA